MPFATFARLLFEHGFDPRDEFETRLRGYRSHVWVELTDGTKHPVTFFDPVRLGHELAGEAERGHPFVGERGLIIVTEVTHESMEAAARELARQGFFEVASPPESLTERASILREGPDE